MLMLISQQYFNMVPQPPLTPFNRAIVLIFALCLHWFAFTERGPITAPQQCVCVWRAASLRCEHANEL